VKLIQDNLDEVSSFNFEVIRNKIYKQNETEQFLMRIEKTEKVGEQNLDDIVSGF